MLHCKTLARWNNALSFIELSLEWLFARVKSLFKKDIFSFPSIWVCSAFLVFSFACEYHKTILCRLRLFLKWYVFTALQQLDTKSLETTKFQSTTYTWIEFQKFWTDRLGIQIKPAEAVQAKYRSITSIQLLQIVRIQSTSLEQEVFVISKNLFIGFFIRCFQSRCLKFCTDVIYMILKLNTVTFFI